MLCPYLALRKTPSLTAALKRPPIMIIRICPKGHVEAQWLCMSFKSVKQAFCGFMLSQTSEIRYLENIWTIVVVVNENTASTDLIARYITWRFAPNHVSCKGLSIHLSCKWIHNDILCTLLLTTSSYISPLQDFSRRNCSLSPQYNEGGMLLYTPCNCEKSLPWGKLANMHQQKE